MKSITVTVLGVVLVGWTAHSHAAAIPAELIHTNKARFRIPFRFDSAEMQSLGAREVRLYVSHDRGATWQHAETVTPQSGHFEFEPPGDGEYWFAVRTLDAGNELHPPRGVNEPGLKVIVDTSRPLLEISLSQPLPGRVEMSWKANDSHLNPSTLRLEYIQSGVDVWQNVNVVPDAAGRTSWSVPEGGFVAVRGSVSDLASNSGQSEQQIRIDPAGSSVPYSPPPSPREPIAMNISNGAGAVPNNGPARRDNPLATNPLGGDFWDGSRSQAPFFADEPSAHDVNEWNGGSEWSSQFVSNAPPSRPDVTQPRYPTSIGRNELGPKLVNSRKFEISYKVEDVGPSGVGGVELYITQDGGHKWYKYGHDPDRTSPFEIEVPHDGAFGFSIRVRSGQGLAADPPQPGEKPEVTVVIDKTPPLARSISAQQGTGSALDKVLVRWSVSEEHPAERPIHLAYATSPNGPWESISGWEPNTGRYIWKIAPGVPQKLYIRLTARDAAGNVSHVETPQPVVVDLSTPSARIVDVDAARGETGLH